MWLKSVLLGTVLFFLLSCEQHKSESFLMIKPVVDQQLVDCQSGFKNNGLNWQITQLQYFISDIQLQGTNGSWRNISLRSTPQQGDNVALLGMHCEEKSPAQWKVEFLDTVNLKDYHAIRFSLGVPFDKNHLNPLTQPSPLNDSSMFWVWQTGHKFLRLELESEQKSWVFHLGSTGCKSPSVMRSPKQACLYPNLITYELPLISNELVFDLSNLLSGIELTTKNSCQSAHNDENCSLLFQNLGSTQENTVFRVQDVN